MNTTSNLTVEDINTILQRNYIGRIGCSADCIPYIVPVTYYFDKDNNAIIGVSNPGMKIKILRDNPQVCFEVEEIKNMTNWSSVVVWGKYEELAGSSAKRALHIFVEKINQLIDYNNDQSPSFFKDLSSSHGHIPESIIYRISLYEKTGKSESDR